MRELKQKVFSTRQFIRIGDSSGATGYAQARLMDFVVLFRRN